MSEHLGTVITSNGEETARAIERDYRMTGSHQWAREIYINAREAGADKIVFSPHAAFAALGLWRMQVADNGCGMAPDEMVGYFRSYGASGKTVGGEHDNMGIGAKTSLLPWNPEGVVVISVKDGDRSMIHIQKIGKEYGLREFHFDEDGSFGVVCDPDFDDEEYGDVNWAESIPDWIEDHGTVVILLGSKTEPHTYVGNPARADDEWRSQSALSKYLNGKFWDLNGTDLSVVEFGKAQIERFAMDDLWARKIIGWENETRYANGLSAIRDGKVVDVPSSVEAEGVVDLEDGTAVHWFVHREGTRTKDLRDHPASTGAISVLHRGETFNVTYHAAHFRQFGIVNESARKRVSLVIEPQDAGDSVKRGVYMTSDRSRLLVRGGRNAGRDLPMADWGNEFFANLPAAIADLRPKISEGRDHAEMVKALWERFGWRWRAIGTGPAGRGPRGIERITSIEGARASVIPPVITPGPGPDTDDGDVETPEKREDKPRQKPARKNPKGRTRSEATGQSANWRWQEHDEFQDGFEWVGFWDSQTQTLVLDRSFSVVVETVGHWQEKYPSHDGEDVQGRVEEALGQVLLSRILHSAFLPMAVEKIDGEVRTPQALTLAICGIVAEEKFMAPMIGGALGRAAA